MTAIQLDSPPRSLCILRLSAIGDVTHVLPLVATLQQVWPETRLTWIIGRLEYELVKSLPGIEFIVFDKRNGMREYLALRRKLDGRCFDVLLMLQVALRANLISLLIRARTRIGYDRARSRDFQHLFCNQQIDGPVRVHVLDGFFQFLEKMGIAKRRMDWLLRADESGREFAGNIIGGRRCVIINPCSSNRRNNWRNWPAEYYAEIVDHIVTKGCLVILTGGPDSQEQVLAENIMILCQSSPINLVGQTSLVQLLALLEQSACLIAPDTGPAHLATVAGTPVIGLYASSNPQRTGPYNDRQIVIDCYPQALQKYSGKDLVEARWGERVRDPDVMRLIGIETVKQRLNEQLDFSPSSD